MMSDVLDELLSIFNCDRASLVYPCDPEAESWTAPMERFRPPYEGVLALGLQVPMDDEVAFCHRLLRSSDGPVPFGKEHEIQMPDGVGERFQIRSQLGMAIYPKNDRPWMFVIHQCSHSRLWQERDIRLFQEIGRRLEDALSNLLMNRNLRESEERLRMVFENSPVSIWEEDFSAVKILFDDLKKHGIDDIETYFAEHPETVRQCTEMTKIVDVNLAALALHGAGNKEELLAGLVNTFTPESFDTFRRELVCLWNGETEMTADAVVKTLAGERRSVTVCFSVCPGYEETLSKVLVSLIDITERKQAESDLKESEERYRAIVAGFDGLIYICSQDYRVEFMNDKFIRRTGYYAKGELCYKALHELDSICPWCVNERVFKGETVRWELKSPKDDRWYYIVNTPIYHADGSVSKQAMILDITERKKVEEELGKHREHLEELVRERTVELEATNKELESFAYSVSHDLRAPLRHIDGFLELLQKQTATVLDERSRHYMDTISDSAKLMSRLIDDLLSFSRMGRQELSRMQVDLNVLVQDIIRELESETKGRIINWHITDLPIVSVDRTLMRAVLVNLISNAIKFTRPREQAEIEIGYQLQDTETIIFIRDNGVGFDPKYAANLFGVFQRLHQVDEFEGTGIGLANVRRIIARHGGRTWAEADIDKGATFYFSLLRSIQGR